MCNSRGSIVIKRLIRMAVPAIWILVGCSGAPETPPPAVVTVQVVATLVDTPPPVVTVLVVATPDPATPPAVATVIVVASAPGPTLALIATPLSIPTREATTPPTQPPPTPSRTPVVASVKATPTSRPRPSASPMPAAPPGTLADGDYFSSGSVRAQFRVSNGGSIASAGFFSFHCQADGALSTYGFTDAAPVAGGKFVFAALPNASGSPMVSMACSVTSATQARCVINNIIATKKCPNTAANVTRQ
jgi:hypothetical protein